MVLQTQGKLGQDEGGFSSRSQDAGQGPPRMGGIALGNGLVLLTERHWAAAIRESDGSISVASGKKMRLPGAGVIAGAEAAKEGSTGSRGGNAGVPFVRGLSRFAETVAVLGVVKSRLPNAQLPIEGPRVAAALAASLAATSAVRVAARRSAVATEVGTALAALVPAVLSVRKSAISGYHGAEHKVIGSWEAAWRAGLRSWGASEGEIKPDAELATKEHERCGSNIVGPYLVATVVANLIARGRAGRRLPAVSGLASVASLGVAIEALRWATEHGDSLLSKILMAPGRLLQKRLTTSEPSPDQLEVGERALEELLRLERSE